MKMETKNRIFDSLFYFVIGILYSYALSSAALAATTLHISQTTVFFLCVLSVVIFYGFFYNKYTSIAFAAIFILAGLFFYVALGTQQLKGEWVTEIAEYVNELVLFVQKKIPYKDEYSRVFSIAVSFLMSFLTVINIRVHFNFYTLTLLGVGVISVPVFLNYNKSDIAILLFIFCFLVLLSKKLNLLAIVKEKGKKNKNSAFAFAVIPVSLALVLIAALLPKPDTPIDGGSFRQSIIDIANNVSLHIGPGSGLMMSFSEEGGRLGGPVALNDRFVMEVDSEERVYLSGSIRDTYTGTSWTLSKTEKAELTVGEYDWYQMPNIPRNSSGRPIEWGFVGNRNTLIIDIGENQMETLFSPPFRYSLWISDDVILSQNNFGMISANQLLSKNTRYAQNYISQDYTSDAFISMLKNWDVRPQNYVRAREGMAPYFALPDSLPRRVSDLAHQLTDGHDNNYDKIKALEEYLATFPYTLEPNKVPPGQDFVDYFLFTGKEGYCVYYASALAVMARSVNIPTRYVEGFVMPPERNENGRYTVTNQQAHAWVEVYFDGFGWVQFEPTASRYADFYNEEAPGFVAGPVLPSPEEENPEGQGGGPNSGNDSAAQDEQAEDQTGDPAGGIQVLSLLFSIFAITILFFVLFIRIRVYIYKDRLEKIDRLSNRKASVAYFSHLLKAVRAYGYPIEETETAHGYAGRIGGELTFAKQTVFMEDLADIFSRAFYSKNKITDEERNRMQECYHEMLVKLRESRMGRVCFFINRYILMKF